LICPAGYYSNSKATNCTMCPGNLLLFLNKNHYTDQVNCFISCSWIFLC
jgi:hypothetical protein